MATVGAATNKIPIGRVHRDIAGGPRRGLATTEVHNKEHDPEECPEREP